MNTVEQKISCPEMESKGKRNALGLCLGASTVSLVHLEQKTNGHAPGRADVVGYAVRAHEGDPKQTLLKALRDFDLVSFDRVAATGRRFRKFLSLSSLPEPEAVEYAYRFIKPEGVSCNAVVSAGGETFMIYALNKGGRISNVLTGNKCASGTGEFFLQQLRRMDVSLEEAAQWSATEKAHYVSGRCSVFCKSDCTHATNKGVPKSRVTAGLCKMMAGKILELLKNVDLKDIMITGGVAQNRMVIECLHKEIPGLVVPEQAPYFEAMGAVFRGLGFNGAAHPPSDEAILKLGRANTSCKECLPLILTTGTLLNYARNMKQEDEILVYFMPTGSGPCRFGQYYIFMEDLVSRLELPDVAMLSLTSENSYAGMGKDFHKLGWCAIVLGDVMEDIRSMLLANATDTKEALAIYEEEWKLLLKELENGNIGRLEKEASKTAARLGRIPMKRTVGEVPVISVVGEIFVRRDELSRQYITERLAEEGFSVICSPVAEWIHYSDYLVDRNLVDSTQSPMEKLKFIFKKKIMGRYEKRIKSILSRSGLLDAKPVDLKAVIRNGSKYISPNLTGEAILTVGSAMREVVTHSCGVIAIGPFGCMPNRLSESILVKTMTGQGKLATDPKNQFLRAALKDVDELPFLAIESDGSPFPQVITAKLESFCLRAGRLHDKITAAKT